jgi:hypothetical protein
MRDVAGLAGGATRRNAVTVIRGEPGLVIVSWLPRGCAGGDGHLRVSCAEPACASVWYSPQHVPGTEVTDAYPPPAPGGIGGSWL